MPTQLPATAPQDALLSDELVEQAARAHWFRGVSDMSEEWAQNMWPHLNKDKLLACTRAALESVAGEIRAEALDRAEGPGRASDSPIVREHAALAVNQSDGHQVTRIIRDRDRARGELDRVLAIADDEMAAMDLWWRVCGDAWAVPGDLPARFLRAAQGEPT